MILYQICGLAGGSTLILKSYSTTLQQHEKAATIFRQAEKLFFVRHLSDSDRKLNRNPDAVNRDRMRIIDPKSSQLGPTCRRYLKSPMEKTKLFVYTRLCLESSCTQIPKHLN